MLSFRGTKLVFFKRGAFLPLLRGFSATAWGFSPFRELNPGFSPRRAGGPTRFALLAQYM